MATGSDTLHHAEACFGEFARAAKHYTFYPPGHPQRKMVLGKVLSTVSRLIPPGEPLILDISKSGASVAGKPLGKHHEHIQSLADDLFLRRVKSLRISSPATGLEVAAFLASATLDPDDLAAQGGMSALLARHRVTHISVEEIHYEKIKEKIAEAAPEDEDILDLDGEEKEEENRDLPPGATPDLTPEEQDALAILADLEGEKDPARYLDILKKMVKVCRGFVDEGKSEIPYRVIHSLVRHQGDITRYDSQRRYAGEAVAALADARAISLLISRVVDSPSHLPEEYVAIFSAIADKAIPVLLAGLVSHSSLKARKKISDILVTFGEKSLPFIFPYLKDQRWYVVRNMLTLLGEIPSDGALGSLREALRHKDLRVKKESIKALASIRSRASLAILVDALKGKDREIAVFSAFALGAIRDRSAVPSLMSIANSSEDVELRLEAISSLGKIGTPDAIPFLKKILFTRRFFRWGPSQEILEAAAGALGEIGGEDAIHTLQAGTAGRSRDIRAYCWDALGAMDDRLGGS